MRFKKFLISIILVKTIQISFSQNMYAPLNLEITDSSLANIGLSWETPEAFRIESITHLNATPTMGVGNADNSPVAYFQRVSGLMLSADQQHGKIIESISNNKNSLVNLVIFKFYSKYMNGICILIT